MKEPCALGSFLETSICRSAHAWCISSLITCSLSKLDACTTYKERERGGESTFLAPFGIFEGQVTGEPLQIKIEVIFLSVSLRERETGLDETVSFSIATESHGFKLRKQLSAYSCKFAYI